MPIVADVPIPSSLAAHEPLRRSLTLLADSQRKPRVDDLKAFSGLAVYSGFISDQSEYNTSQFGGSKWFEAVDKMRNHSTIGAIESLITLPLLATHWEVVPPKDAGSASKEAAELLNANLMSGLYRPFTEVVRTALLSLLYGVRLLNPRRRVEDNKILYDDFEDLLPHTYYQWFFENNRPISVTQRGTDTEGKTREENLKLSELVRLTWREEGGNPRGRPILFPIRGDWYRSEFISSVCVVAAARAGVGAWMGKIPREMWEDRELRNTIEDLLKKIQSKEGGAAVIPSEVAVEPINALRDGGIEGLMKLLDHYDTRMAKGALANLLQLGMRDVGTQALANVLFDMFILNVDGAGAFVRDAFNMQVVKPWHVWNYPGMKSAEFAQLQFTSTRFLLKRDELTKAVNEATTAGNLPQGAEEIQNYMRDVLGLPPAPEKKDDGKRQATAGNGRGNTSRLLLSSPDVSFIDRERERIAKQQDAFQRAMTAFLEKAQDKALDAVEDVAREYAKADAMQRGAVISKVHEIELKGMSEYASLIRSWLWDFYQKLRKRIEEESKQTLSAVSNETRQRITGMANDIAEKHFADLQFALRATADRVIASGASAAQVRQAVLNEYNLTASRNFIDLTDAGEKLMTT